ncbi:MAG: thermonuclease family protein [Planctomycetes bacterium]|nr:thermonuclease family protein [Planctomycetota bacterium]
MSRYAIWILTGTLALPAVLAEPEDVVGPAAGPPRRGESFVGKVVGVSDGDTISVMRQGKAEKIRLYGIDCPEKAQPFGNRAKELASQLAFGKVVTVRVVSIDRYGRAVSWVTLPDDASLNQELVKAGLAWWYEQFAPDATELQELEEQARASGRGLWSDPQPIPPWDFRKARSQRNQRPE